MKTGDDGLRTFRLVASQLIFRFRDNLRILLDGFDILSDLFAENFSGIVAGQFEHGCITLWNSFSQITKRPINTESFFGW